MKLAHMTWKQAKKAITSDTLVILPVGSVEQHGSLGLLGTDFLIPTNLAERLEKNLDCIVLPTLPYGICPYHMEFPGSINIGAEALRLCVDNILLSMMHHGARRFLLLNGHMGNTMALEDPCLNVYQHGGLAAQINWFSIATAMNSSYGGGHADATEVSVVKAVCPEHMQDTSGYEKAERIGLTENMPAQRLATVLFKGIPVRVVRSVEGLTTTGECGPWDSSEATAAVGEEILEGCTKFIVEFAQEFVKAPLHVAKKKP